MLPLDHRIFFALYAADDGALTPAARALSAVGSGWALLALLPLFWFPAYRRLAWTLTLALSASASVVFVLKQLVGRARPCASLPGVRALSALAPTDPSFPSGHACGSFTFAAFVTLIVLRSGTDSRHAAPPRRLVASVSLFSFAAAVSWSRVYLGVHFPLDVTAGAALGAISGVTFGSSYLRARVRGRGDSVA